MHRLDVELGDRSYAIHAGGDLLADPEWLARVLTAPALFIISDDNVAPHYLPSLRAALGQRLRGELVLPAGEAQKQLDTLSRVFDHLAECRIGRDAALVALGGGVVGDLTGFAAACWQRGIDFYQVPTTLLAQVDASVGGKTAVNHPAGKNLIGAFHQPRAVIADTDTLATLPEREFRAGLAEVVKHALIADPDFLAWLEARVEALNAREPETVGETVLHCCRIKAAVVSEDERERGRRAILNFGHTFGHVIEGALGYGQWLHGEAVAAGMVQAMVLSRTLGLLNEEEQRRAVALMERLKLPCEPPALSVDTWLEWMSRDKKATSAGLRFVLLDGLGRAIIRDDVPESRLREVLACEMQSP
ncbi:3-dehydroquinate synthase [Gammaproteobacteria bacterium AB-CW1]|uniref:3-dehydroquinate synthase n=1 Tax=Natronospira elongata TaxID=3110268 RepID=A0AAP6JEX9_9GAMM|nr:3-dehydroquinate synthase [Gammaproteobacteria bacterium AB-CW1]